MRPKKTTDRDGYSISKYYGNQSGVILTRVTLHTQANGPLDLEAASRLHNGSIPALGINLQNLQLQPGEGEELP